MKSKLSFLLIILGLQFIFENNKQNRPLTVTGVSMGNVGFAISSSNPIRYFVTNYVQNKIYVFDEEWNYVSEKSSFTSVNYIIQVDNYFYITGNQNVWKTDQQLNVLIQLNSTGSTPNYRGIYYNSTNSLIYVAATSLKVINILNLNLTLTHTISTAPYLPWSISFYNNQ
jgi:hypothetical protein